eukprot:scaffold1236_cov116-Isochrysis_galbana.AAC.1
MRRRADGMVLTGGRWGVAKLKREPKSWHGIGGGLLDLERLDAHAHLKQPLPEGGELHRAVRLLDVQPARAQLGREIRQVGSASRVPGLVKDEGRARCVHRGRGPAVRRQTPQGCPHKVSPHTGRTVVTANGVSPRTKHCVGARVRWGDGVRIRLGVTSEWTAGLPNHAW